MTHELMEIEYEIACLKFKQRGLTTDSIEWRKIQTEIFDLEDLKLRSVHNYRPAR